MKWFGGTNEIIPGKSYDITICMNNDKHTALWSYVRWENANVKNQVNCYRKQMLVFPWLLWVIEFGCICIWWCLAGGTIRPWIVIPWWRHQKETFSALLALCAGNSPVTGEFPSQRPVTRSFDVFFGLCLNKRLSKQSWGWWFKTPSRSLWRHCNGWHLYANTRAHFNIWLDVLSSDLAKSRSGEISSLYYHITLKFDRHIDSSAADVPVKFQSDQTILNTKWLRDFTRSYDKTCNQIFKRGTGIAWVQYAIWYTFVQIIWLLFMFVCFMISEITIEVL